jgi:hypothetical protein
MNPTTSWNKKDEYKKIVKLTTKEEFSLKESSSSPPSKIVPCTCCLPHRPQRDQHLDSQDKKEAPYFPPSLRCDKHEYWHYLTNSVASKRLEDGKKSAQKPVKERARGVRRYQYYRPVSSRVIQSKGEYLREKLRIK